MNSIFPGIKISAISSAVPAHYLDMSDLYGQFGEKEVKRIVASTGIESIRIAPKKMITFDLCVAAAKNIFNHTDTKPKDIDAIVFVSQTPTYRMPATSCLIQEYFGISNKVLAFDINYGCSAYIYGLFQAALLISSKVCQKVLLCVGDTMTHYLNPQDLKTRLVLGDAAAATIIEGGSDLAAFNLMTDGAGYRHLIIDKTEEGQDAYLQMDGSAIMEFALREVPLVIANVMQQVEWQTEEVELLALHQANTFMLNYLRKKMRFSPSTTPIAVNGYGNTGPASIPLMLCHCAEDYKASAKNKVIMAGFGVGLSWGAVATSLAQAHLLPVIELE